MLFQTRVAWVAWITAARERGDINQVLNYQPTLLANALFPKVFVKIMKMKISNQTVELDKLLRINMEIQSAVLKKFVSSCRSKWLQANATKRG